MNDHRDEEDALRRALHDAAAHVPPLHATAAPVERRGPKGVRGRRLLAGALVVLFAIAAVPLGAALLDADGRGDKPVDGAKGKQLVFEAVAATLEAGSYDFEFRLRVTPATRELAPCPTASSGYANCTSQSGPTDLSGRGTVNSSPYAMTMALGYGSYNGYAVWTNESTAWVINVDDASTRLDPLYLQGMSLPAFVGMAESVLGRGPGAMLAISFANSTGHLELEKEAVTGVKPDGTDVLADGTNVSYYRVRVDLRKMADAAGLSDEQREAINGAVSVLRAAGYSGTDERIGVDEAGFVREVVATTNFGDGSSVVRHTSFSNFGCAKRVSMPNVAPVDAIAGTCPPVAPVTTTAPSTTSTTPDSTTSSVPTPTTAAPTTSLPATSLPSTTTTPESAVTTIPPEP